jgi:glucose-6-phosphate 1-epimerase
MKVDPVLADLNHRFGNERVRFEQDAGGLTRAEITTRHSRCRLYLQGAHVTEFQKRGEAPLLYLSERSEYRAGRPIRGGIPVIFPWFGPHGDDPRRPAHGFARTMAWSVIDVHSSPEQAQITLRLEANEATRALWPHDFAAKLVVEIGETLSLSLELENRANQSMGFETALHSYLRVGDVERVKLKGLENTKFIDKTDGLRRKNAGSDAMVVIGELDSVFLETATTCSIDDPMLGRRLIVTKGGSLSTIVWNPHVKKAELLPDLEPNGWRHFLCVESGNVADNRVVLAPLERKVMTLTIASEPLAATQGNCQGEDGGRIDRLERQGLLKRATKKLPEEYFLEKLPKPTGTGAVAALLAEREESW